MVAKKKVRMRKSEVMGVLKWLRELLKWVSVDPASRYQEALKQVNEKKDLVVKAMEEVVEPEFKKYIPIISAVSGYVEGGDVAEASEGEEGTGNRPDNAGVHAGGGKEQSNGPDKVQHVVKK